eukprot:CAMPEP_0117694884 /NCGR_PEP_ID=MMETSP0804-20121206/27749_1 /TAXON_ID=1074897 /ORGANISM="Tetraselmis astigmatica, Strain CCMP880" /LENGTH=93 /DNA_ID=CAMNT_0005508729 /DNA_START=306 /DNA_END=587 /DNA_ORIENTATION=-
MSPIVMWHPRHALCLQPGPDKLKRVGNQLPGRGGHCSIGKESQDRWTVLAVWVVPQPSVPPPCGAPQDPASSCSQQSHDTSFSHVYAARSTPA